MNDHTTMLEPHRTVLLLLEFQQQWTQPGLFHFLIRRELHTRQVMHHAAQAVTHARRHGIPVIHAPLVVDPHHKRGLYAWLTWGLFFRKGSAAAQLDTRVYAAGDIVAAGRTAFDAFTGSNLQACLENTGRDQLLVAGFATDQCVARTAATARQHGFSTWLLSDASATFAAALHRRAERSFGGKVMLVTQWLHNRQQASA
jgi:nicotinamidase-related amidase